MDNSNTGENSPRKGQFRKGDPRINRKGRPKSFDALRILAQQIAHEAETKGNNPLVIKGHIVTIAENILRQWAASKNPQLQRAFIEIAFGKVPDKVELGGSTDIILRVVRDMQSGSTIPDSSAGTARKTSGNKGE